MTLPDRINQRWSMDFVSDQLALGRRFRTLNIVDDKSRECLSIEVGTSLTGHAGRYESSTVSSNFADAPRSSSWTTAPSSPGMPWPTGR